MFTEEEEEEEVHRCGDCGVVLTDQNNCTRWRHEHKCCVKCCDCDDCLSILKEEEDAVAAAARE